MGGQSIMNSRKHPTKTPMIETFLSTVQRIKILDFQAVLLLTVFTCIVRIACMSFGIEFSACLAYCPMIYLYKKNINERFLVQKKYALLYQHITYFLMMMTLEVLFPSVTSSVITILYLIIYLVLINREIRRQIRPSGFLNSKNMISLYHYFTVLCIATLLINLFEKKFGAVINFDCNLIRKGISVICILFSVVFLLTLQKEIPDDAEGRSESAYEEVSNNLFINGPLVDEINVFFATSDRYLHPNFTIKDLAAVLGTTRERISKAMNEEMRDGFYTIIARHRIEHAKKIILENDNLTIEAITEQCGFNSKSTFNKYFKIYTGMPPSVYRKDHEIKK